MTDGYYHAPGQGRVGPLSADEMRARFRDRRITRDMLAWHDGLREWQEYLDLLGPLLTAPPTRAPTVGIAVNAVGGAPACH